MCDALAIVRPSGVLFAKNSDRDPNEAQLLEWHPRREHPANARLRCTWIEVPQVRETHAVLLSRPFWMWGAEMGANEHHVIIGNEAVFTREKLARSGLTGMDLVRLALERSRSAGEAVEVIVELLLAHGQGGGAGHENRSFSYHNSFLVADPAGAYVLETADKHWASEPVEGARSISNVLTIPEFAERHSDRLKTWASRARRRLPRSRALAEQAASVGDLFRILRDHGPDHDHPRYDLLSGGFSSICAHAGGTIVSSQTTASWVAELAGEGVRHWVTATAAPCTGLFKPVRVAEPLDLGPAPTDRPDAHSLFWRHERLHRRTVRDPARLLPLFAPERDATERAWLAEPPEPAAAFARGSELLATWEERVGREPVRDVRPAWTRRYWRKRDRGVLAGESVVSA